MVVVVEVSDFDVYGLYLFVILLVVGECVFGVGLLCLWLDDVCWVICEGCEGNLVIFVVDVFGLMVVWDWMVVVSGVILLLLCDVY